MKRVLLLLLIAIVILAAVLVGRAMTLSSMQITAAPARLSRAIQFQTVSPGDAAQFDAFLGWLAQAYPRVHASMQGEPIGKSVLR